MVVYAARQSHGPAGAVSRYSILRGPAEAIRREVRARLWQLGRQGGHFCSLNQDPPFPPGHIRAFDETIERSGGYPFDPHWGRPDSHGSHLTPKRRRPASAPAPYLGREALRRPWKGSVAARQYGSDWHDRCMLASYVSI